MAGLFGPVKKCVNEVIGVVGEVRLLVAGEVGLLVVGEVDLLVVAGSFLAAGSFLVVVGVVAKVVAAAFLAAFSGMGAVIARQAAKATKTTAARRAMLYYRTM